MPDLDEIAGSAPPMGRNQQYPGENLEGKVNNTSDNNNEKEGGLVETIKSFGILDWLKVSATTAIGYLYGGGLLNIGVGLASSILGYAWSQKNKIKKTELKAEMYSMGFMLPVGWGYLKFLDAFIPSTIGKAITTVLTAGILFNPLAWGFRYLFNNYSISGAVKNLFKLPGELYGKAIKPNFIESYIRGLKFSIVTGPLSYLIFKKVPLDYQLPIFSLQHLFTGTLRQKLEIKQAERKGMIGDNYKPSQVYK